MIDPVGIVLTAVENYDILLSRSACTAIPPAFMSKVVNFEFMYLKSVYETLIFCKTKDDKLKVEIWKADETYKPME